MNTLTVTARGQVTFKKDVLQHMGIRPGARIHFEKLPGGELRLKVAKPSGTIDAFVGLCANQAGKVLSVEEMNEIARAGWAGKTHEDLG